MALPNGDASGTALYGSISHQYSGSRDEEDDQQPLLGNPPPAPSSAPPPKPPRPTPPSTGNSSSFRKQLSSLSRPSSRTGLLEKQASARSARQLSVRPAFRSSPSFSMRKDAPENSRGDPDQGSFLQDARYFVPGSIPHSMVLAVTIGVVCGVAAWIYYAALWFVLEYVWHTLPRKFVVDQWPEHLYVLWIPLVGFTLAICVGLTVRFMGEPGDLPYTIKCVHEKAYVAMDHVMPMVCASQFSIVAGGSLGPEAPLVAICAALGGFISRKIFGQTERNLIRKHTLMGMAGALAAFFGVPLGGSLFALEVNSRFGIEYFEHTVEAIMSGEICLAVFRQLAGIPIESIWVITPDKLEVAAPVHIMYGILIGFIGAFTAWLFAVFHKHVVGMFRSLNLLSSHRAIERALLGSVVVVGLGMCLPATMFWGEFEFQTIASLDKSSTLEHIWPTAGLFQFEMNSPLSALTVGVAKLIAVSFTVAGGYRGGYIFPAFASAAALGRALYFFLPFIPVQLCVLCFAAAINVALTRTALATTLILAGLSGEPSSISAVLASALVSLFATGYMNFIQTQTSREDMPGDEILYDIICEEDEDLEDDLSLGGDQATEASSPTLPETGSARPLLSADV